MSAKRGYSKYFPVLFIFADLLALSLAFLLSYERKFNRWINIDPDYLNLFFFLIILWLITFFSTGLQEIKRESRLLDHINKLLTALVINLFIVFAFWFLLKPYNYSREFLFFSYLIFTFILIGWRSIWHYFIRYYRARGYNYRNVLVIGKNELTQDLVDYFEVDKGLGYRFLGFLDTTKSSKVIGEPDMYEQIAKEKEADIIFVYTPDFKEKEVKRLIDFAENHLIKVKLVSQFSALGYNNMAIHSFGAIPTINITALPLDKRLNQVTKRAFDIVFSVIVMVALLSWLLPLVAILIRLESRGPVFFRQERNGLDNIPFRIYKFRSMYMHRDEKVEQAKKGDPRITRIGAFIRKTSIDELPQFLNVLKGEMSVVGPRPHAVKHNEEFRKKIDRFIQRHAVKPGITGLAQAKGYRGETTTFNDINARVKLDKFYVRNWSLWLDIRIIALTITSIIKGSDNAY